MNNQVTKIKKTNTNQRIIIITIENHSHKRFTPWPYFLADVNTNTYCAQTYS